MPLSAKAGCPKTPDTRPMRSRRLRRLKAGLVMADGAILRPVCEMADKGNSPTTGALSELRSRGSRLRPLNRANLLAAGMGGEPTFANPGWPL
jgi:hypothetical protein